MTALLAALGLFLAAFGLHLLLWRLNLGSRKSYVLLAIFAIVALGAGMFGWHEHTLMAKWELSAEDEIGIGLYYLGAVACYLITYTGIQDTSPSLVIIRTLEKAGGRGCDRQELDVIITTAAFFNPRLQSLLDEGIVAQTDGLYHLTTRGLRVARFAARLEALFGSDDD